MKNVRFKPWIGPEYDKSGFDGLRILVLGESEKSIQSSIF